MGGFAFAADSPAKKPEVLAFTFSHADPDKAKTEPFPYFRVFPGGKDKKGVDASGTLSTLKAARGESKLYQAEDAKPGLIVVLRRIVFIPQPGGDYQAVFEGEFNAVKLDVPKRTMDKLLRGDTTELLFESETTKGIRPLAFTIKPKTTLRVALRDGKLVILGGKGESTIVHYGLLGTFTYESDPIELAPEENTKPIYIGASTKPKLKNGQPETLPVLN